MSETQTVGRMIFKSRLISGILLLLSVACFAIMTALPSGVQPTAEPPSASKQQPGKTAPKAADTDRPVGGMVPGTPTELAEQIRARLAAADFFEPDFYVSLTSLRTRLGGLVTEESAQAQKQIVALQDLEKRLVAVRGLAPTINRELEFLLSKGGPLFKGIIPSASPFLPISNVLEKLRVDFLNIQARRPLEGMRSFQSSLKALLEARDKLDAPALAPEMNERRKAIVARIDSLTLMRRAKDWESASFAAMAISAELNRVAGAMATPPVRAAEPTEVGLRVDDAMLPRIFGVLGAIALLLSILEVLRLDRRLLAMIDLAAVDAAFTNSGRFVAIQKASDNLPYLQLAARQSSDLGKQLIAAIKRLGVSVSDMEHPKEVSREDPRIKALIETQFRAREIQRSFSVLKEQSIRMSLAVSQSNAEAQILELGDRLSDSIEHVESLTRGLQRELDDAVARQMSSESEADPVESEAVALRRDTEALLLITGQWTRQFDRLNEALADLDKLLNVAANTTSRKQMSDDDAPAARKDPS